MRNSTLLSLLQTEHIKKFTSVNEQTNKKIDYVWSAFQARFCCNVPKVSYDATSMINSQAYFGSSVAGAWNFYAATMQPWQPKQGSNDKNSFNLLNVTKNGSFYN